MGVLSNRESWILLLLLLLTSLMLCQPVSLADTTQTSDKANGTASDKASGKPTVKSSSDSPASSQPASKDGEKVFSPDRSKFAFVRSSDELVAAGNGDVSADVIYLGSTKNPEEAVPLMKKFGTVKTGQPIGDITFGGIYDLTFSPDSKELYFLNAAYAVSAAVLAVDLKSHAVRYVTDGNSLSIVNDGKWKGNLLIEQHKYNNDGAYDAKSIISPQGKVLQKDVSK